MREKAPDFKVRRALLVTTREDRFLTALIISQESMEIGRDWDSTWKNRWPAESAAPHFKETFLDFFQVRAYMKPLNGSWWGLLID